MKKLLLLFVLLLARNGFAAYASGGNILQSQTKYNTSTGYLTLDIDWSGFAGGISVTALVQGGNVSVTAMPAYSGAVGISGTALAALTNTAANTALGATEGTLSALSINTVTGYGYLTTTAYGTAGRGGSFTAVALNAGYSMNITFAAGINAPCIVTVYPGNSTPTAAYWNSGPSWLAPTTPLAVSSTPLMFTAGIGDFLNLSPTVAGNLTTLQVRYAPIY